MLRPKSWTFRRATTIDRAVRRRAVTASDAEARGRAIAAGAKLASLREVIAVAEGRASSKDGGADRATSAARTSRHVIWTPAAVVMRNRIVISPVGPAAWVAAADAMFPAAGGKPARAALNRMRRTGRAFPTGLRPASKTPFVVNGPLIGSAAKPAH